MEMRPGFANVSLSHVSARLVSIVSRLRPHYKQTPPHAKRTRVSCLLFSYSCEELHDPNQKRLNADLEAICCRRDLQLLLHATDLGGKRGT